jgi:protocatechuate 3,4-dioxygenase beta subunit
MTTSPAPTNPVPQPLATHAGGLSRRQALTRIGAVAGAGLVLAARPDQAFAAARAVAVDPEETAGPYPADGSNGVDVVDASLVRRRMRTDVDGTNRQDGIPLDLRLKVWDVDAAEPVDGVWVYVWHCNVDGEYSGYSGQEGHSWLRAVQPTDADGNVRFRTIIPGRYDGRASHIHLAVFPDDTFDPNNKLATTQLAFRNKSIDAIYATDDRYATSLTNATYNANDNVFSDGWADQLLRLKAKGSGYVGRSTIGL